MSEGRRKYAAMPLSGLKHARGGSVMPPDGGGPGRRGKRRSYGFLQFCMTALLPLLFLAALILGYTELHWVFLGLSAVALLVMWGLRAFVPQARTTMTLIYTALMIVSLGAALWFTHPMINKETEETATTSGNYSGLFDRDTTAKDVKEYASQQNANAATETPKATEISNSLPAQKLELYMNYWQALDYESMLSCCLPGWVSNQADPQREIFRIHGTSIPTRWESPQNQGSSEINDSCTLSINVYIDKLIGKGEQKYRYEVLMLRINGEWYIDPVSLSSPTEEREKVTPTVFYTLQPTATVDSAMVLYYNPDGGSYYHRNENCTRVDNKYLPLRGSFRYGQLGQSPYNELKPCPGCNAPNRPN